MIHNADDAQYVRATKPPSLRFTGLDSELLVDTNEDGFTVGNVKSICDNGDSSKKEDPNTIGEKGLGLKSVFSIAREVHIQSRLWSFHINHDRNDDG